MAGRLDHETRQQIRRALSDRARGRSRNAARLEKELENEMTITAPIMCACEHPFRQHAFGGGCTLAGCDCQKFDLDEVGNGNGHQVDGRDALERMDRGEAQKAPPAPAADSVSVRSGRGRSDWTRELIIERIQSWAAEHDGQPPTTKDWALAAPDHPNTSLMRARFGTFADAVEAAGFPRPVRGGLPHHTGAAKTQAAETESPSQENGSRPNTPPPAAPPAPPPVVESAPEQPRVALICLRLGRWELHRNEDGSDCKLYRGNDVLEDVDWQELLRLPALISAVAAAFGEAGE